MASHVCPSWLAFFHATPLRKWVHPPEKILRPLIHPGHTVVDFGCGPGFFTLAAAELTGPEGLVFAADLQPAMLRMARKRARKAGLENRIVFHQCESGSTGLTVPADIILAMYVVHELPDQALFLTHAFSLLKPGGKLLISEPVMHVPQRSFEMTIQHARQAGFVALPAPEMKKSRTVLFSKLLHGSEKH